MLVHEGFHFWQYKTGKYYQQSSKENEVEANRHMLVYLQAIKSSQHNIDYLQRLVSEEIDHSDLNHDGVYDIHDYELRDY